MEVWKEKKIILKEKRGRKLESANKKKIKQHKGGIEKQIRAQQAKCARDKLMQIIFANPPFSFFPTLHFRIFQPPVFVFSNPPFSYFPTPHLGTPAEV